MNDEDMRLSESIHTPEHIDTSEADLPESVREFFQHVDSHAKEIRRMFKEIHATMAAIDANLDLTTSKLDRWSANIKASLESFMR